MRPRFLRHSCFVILSSFASLRSPLRGSTRFAVLAVSLCSAVIRHSSLLASPLTPDDELKTFRVEPPLRVELVAAEPLVESPCAMAFDEKGRLFVAENRGYPNTTEPPQGRIVMLEDTDGDGRMD